MDKKTDWVMVRLPRELRDALVRHGLSMKEPELKMQGNHEDNQAEGPPLWWVIRELLALEQKHRKRGLKNSVPRKRTAAYKVNRGLGVIQSAPELPE